ncbi:hypothetical protein WN944_014801 [Citrus x changshan-huyou]|uniref:Uncharacterized protein n=1 Tax=Citrus x changshan-huyou TaxID=2935761 RepID=A0AAP0QLW7_9ROSI
MHQIHSMNCLHISFLISFTQIYFCCRFFQNLLESLKISHNFLYKYNYVFISLTPTLSLKVHCLLNKPTRYVNVVGF